MTDTTRKKDDISKKPLVNIYSTIIDMESGYISFPSLTADKPPSPEQTSTTKMASKAGWSSYTSFPDSGERIDDMYRNTCAICSAAMNLTGKQALKTLSCGHCFHKSCIFKCFSSQLKEMTAKEGPLTRATCPSCPYPDSSSLEVANSSNRTAPRS